MAETATKQVIGDWQSDPLKPKLVLHSEVEIWDAEVQAECVEDNEVAVHVQLGKDEATSLYMTPVEANLLAERIRTCAQIAERLATDA